MLSRFLKSREAKKLFRDKSAIVAMVVIAGYLLVALAMMFDVVSRDDCANVVGPNSVPGFFLREEPERRYEIARTSLFGKVKRALEKSDPEAALAEVQLGKLRVADKTPAELQAIVDEAVAIQDQLKEAESLDDDPEMLSLLETFESITAELVAPLSGSDRFMHGVALLLGTDAQGRSILFRGVYSIKVAIQIGVVTALVSVLIGAVLGSAAGYFGGWVDALVVWLYTTFSSIPNLVLLVVIAYAFQATDSDVKDTLLPVYIAFCATFWIGTCRVVRGETMKLKQLEYVQAAKTAGFGSMRVLFRHVLPNTSHLLLINFSLLLIGAIKSEVILSYLGLGVKSQPSWGIMIRDAGNNGDVMTGFFWQIGTATALMFVLVLAFNILSDALQDAFDPKHL
ncbi:MAG: ABC transporter permease [Planctomycetes bacterium]|nr:ABC transporter permease [Planctomycetota bacterium]